MPPVVHSQEGEGHLGHAAPPWLQRHPYRLRAPLLPPAGAEGASRGALNQQVTLPLRHMIATLWQDDSEQRRPHLAAGPYQGNTKHWHNVVGTLLFG